MAKVYRFIPVGVLWWTAIVVPFLLLILLHASPVFDPDFPWHITVGKLILQNHAIPSTDPFSYTMAGHRWIAHEWLFEVVSWLIYSVGSYPAICILKVVVLFFAIWLPVLAWRRGMVSPFSIFICLTLAVLVAISRSFWRPHLLGILMVAIFLKVLEDFVEGRKNLLWILPILTIIWTNWHSGVIFGTILIFTYAATAYPIKKRTRKRSGSTPDPMPFGKLLTIGFISLACVFINPDPLEAPFYPFKLVSAFSSTLSKVAGFWELQPISLSQFHVFWFAAALAVLGMIIAWKKLKLRHALILAGIILASILRLRMVELFIPAYVMFGPGIVQGILDQIHEKFIPPRAVAVSAVYIIIVLAITTQFTSTSISGIPKLGLEMDSYPIACADWAEKHNPSGYLYNDLSIGGYLIYRLYPNHPVFWYNELILFEPLFKRLASGESIENIHFIDWVIDINSDTSNPYTPDKWALMTFDQGYSLYIKRSGSASNLIGSDEYSILYPCRPEEIFRNAGEYSDSVKTQMHTELIRYLNENDTIYARTYVAGALMALGENLDEARGVLDTVPLSDRDNINYRFYDALYDFETGNLDSAEHKLRVDIFWHPRSVEQKILLGRIYAERGDIGQASKIFKRVIDSNSSHPYVLFMEAKLLAGLGKKAEAASTLEKYFQNVSTRDAGTREYYTALELGRELTE